MVSLEDILENIDLFEKDFGYVYSPGFGAIYFSKEGMELFLRNKGEINRMIELCKKYNNEEIYSEDLDNAGFKLIDEGFEGSVYSVFIGKEKFALKVYHTDMNTEVGRTYFEDLLRTENEGIFETVHPYIAGEGFLLMELIPEDYIDFDDFVKEFPDLAIKARNEVLRMQRGLNLEDAGHLFDVDFESQFDEDELDEEDYESNPKHVYVNNVEGKLKYLIIDMGYDF